MGLCQAMVGSGAARRERPVRPRLLLQEALLTLSTPFHQYPLVFCEERSLTVAALLGAGCVGAGAHATRGIPLKQRQYAAVLNAFMATYAAVEESGAWPAFAATLPIGSCAGAVHRWAWFEERAGASCRAGSSTLKVRATRYKGRPFTCS